jgi:hypothetical protein
VISRSRIAVLASGGAATEGPGPFTITDGGAGDALVTTTLPHTLATAPNKFVVLEGTSGYDGMYSVETEPDFYKGVGQYSVTGANTFKLLGAYTADSAGTWRFGGEHTVLRVTDDAESDGIATFVCEGSLTGSPAWIQAPGVTGTRPIQAFPAEASNSFWLTDLVTTNPLGLGVGSPGTWSEGGAYRPTLVSANAVSPTEIDLTFDCIVTTSGDPTGFRTSSTTWGVVNALSTSGDTTAVIRLTMDGTAFSVGDTITVTYDGSGSAVESFTSSGTVTEFSDVVATNSVPSRFVIDSIAPDGTNNYLMTTAVPHGLAFGEWVDVTGNSEPTYNRTWGAIEDPLSPTTVVLSTGGDATLTGTGGTWAYNDAKRHELTVSDDSGVALFTTPNPHGLVGDEFVDISGTDDGLYDGMKQVSVIVSPHAFYVGDAYGGASAAGEWQFVPAGRLIVSVTAFDTGDPDNVQLLFTTAAPHGLSGGENVAVIGNSLAGNHNVDELVDGTSFHEFSGYAGDVFGGAFKVNV